MFGQALNFLIVNWAIITPIVVIALLVISKSFRAGVAFLLRVIARPLLLAAVVALVYDGTKTLAGGGNGLVFTSLAEIWQANHPTSLTSLKGVISQLHPMAWEKGALSILRLPAWAVVGTVGLVLAWIGRKRPQPKVFVN